MKLKNICFILLSAILTILSHPSVFFGWHLPEMSWLAFVSYIPLFYLFFEKENSKKISVVFLFGFLFYMGALYWLYTALNGYGHLPPVIAVLVLLLLALVLSAYLTIVFYFAAFLENKLHISCFWTLPIVWVSFEWCRTHWPLGGFPWAQAAYSQWKNLNFIQVSDLLGVYGVTALLVWINLAFLEFFKVFRQKKIYKTNLIKISFVLICVIATCVYGHKRKLEIENISQYSPHFNLALLQGNIPQDEKWLAEKSEEILKIYQDMTKEAFSNSAFKVDLVIWPESSFPYEIARDQQDNIDYVGSFDGDVLVGAVSYENKGRLPPDILYTPLDFPVYNSALLIEPGSHLSGSYFKHHLVPYGEYIPLKKILPFIGKLTGQMGEFIQGSEYNLLESGPAKMGILICYEDIFPSIAQTLTKNGANLLVNMTNDAWYGDSSALPQHLSFSTFRAIENRRSLVRSTNTGMTATFDAAGNIWALLPSYKQMILYDKVPLINVTSFYSQHGDVFAYACLAISGLLIVGAILVIARGKHKVCPYR